MPVSLEQISEMPSQERREGGEDDAAYNTKKHMAFMPN